MNRPIKVRAWDKDKKEWISSEYVFLTLDGQLCVNEAMLYEGNYELVQYTGLKAKNGEICEGDVIRISKADYRMGLAVGKEGDDMAKVNRPEFLITWEKDSAGFYVKDINLVIEFGEEIISGVYLWTIASPKYNKEVEIIGNIMENKELLE